MNMATSTGALEAAKAKLAEIVEGKGLLDAEVTVSVSGLTPEQAIGRPKRRDFPIIEGREQLVEATVNGAKGHAFTDSAQDFRGTLRDVLATSLSSNRNRAEFVAVLNAVILLLLDMNDAHKVYDIISGVPAWILVVAVVVAPVTEELFFRAALFPRVGMVLSSLLFGLFHISYGSIAEIIGAFLIGMVFAFVYKKSKSIITPILLHVGFNLVSVVAVLIANGWFS